MEEKWVAIFFVQVAIICVGTHADRNPSSSLAATSQIKRLMTFLVTDAWEWKVLWLGAELISFRVCLLVMSAACDLEYLKSGILWLSPVPGQCTLHNRSIALFAIPVISFRVDT